MGKKLWEAGLRQTPLKIPTEFTLIGQIQRWIFPSFPIIRLTFLANNLVAC